MKRSARTVEDYLRLPYTIQLRRYEDGTFFADVAELPGCMTEADTAEEALEMIKDAMAGWMEVALSEGIPIPEPAREPDYSGRFLVRAPKSLHRELTVRWARERHRRPVVARRAGDARASRPVPDLSVLRPSALAERYRRGRA